MLDGLEFERLVSKNIIHGGVCGRWIDRGSQIRSRCMFLISKTHACRRELPHNGNELDSGNAQAASVINLGAAIINNRATTSLLWQRPPC